MIIHNSYFRELEEECGLISDDLKSVGILMFEFEGNPQLWEVHVYQSWDFTGTLIETDGKLS